MCTAKKEEKRLEKAAKFAAKNVKTVATPGDKKVKEKEKKDVEPPFVNTTPKGEKKGEIRLDLRLEKLSQPSFRSLSTHGRWIQPDRGRI